MEQIKRVNIGSYVRVVSGKCGIITGSDKDNVFFTAYDGEETKVYRGAAFKCTRKEYEAAVAKHEQELAELAAKAEKDAKEQKARKKAARAKPAPKSLAQALEANEQELAEEDAEDGLQGEDLDLTPEDAAEAQGEGHGDADEDIEDEGETAPGSIVKSEYKARYLNTRSATGSSSKICGDAISVMMNGQTVERCAEIVAEHTGDSAADLLSRYEHLNPGQRRMNIGNRLRHWAKENAPEMLIKPGQEGDEE